MAKFKFRQYQNTAISQNLMPAKFSRYTVTLTPAFVRQEYT